MILKQIDESQKSEYNNHVTHVMQSWEWGEFRKSLGTKVKRYGLYDGKKLTKAFQITFHQIPIAGKYVGYLPKGPFPDKDLAEALLQIGREESCAFIKIEPNITIEQSNNRTIETKFKKSPKPLFTKHNFLLDITKSEEELLKAMHPKTRYNIRVAEKHGVIVEEREDDKALDIYLKLYFETTERQGYHGHNRAYHTKAWETLKSAGIAKILIGSLKNEPLTAWMLLNFKDTLYYPYGGSSKAHPEVMANNLVAWEAIKLGKKLGCKKFDMWGALGPTPNPNDPWIGFHRFKKGYGGDLVEYLGTFDLVINWPIYYTFSFIDKMMPLKLFLLKMVGRNG